MRCQQVYWFELKVIGQAGEGLARAQFVGAGLRRSSPAAAIYSTAGQSKPDMAYTLDTHATVRELTDAGLDQPVAEAITAVIARSESELVTRSFFKTELKAEIAALEKRLMLYGLGLAGLLFAALRFTGSG